MLDTRIRTRVGSVMSARRQSVSRNLQVQHFTLNVSPYDQQSVPEPNVIFNM